MISLRFQGIWFRALCRSPNLPLLHLEDIKHFSIQVIHARPNLLHLSYVPSCYISLILSILSTITNPLFQFDDTNPIEEAPSPQFFYLDSLEVVNPYCIPYAFPATYRLQGESRISKSIIYFRIIYWITDGILSLQSLTTLDLPQSAYCKFHLALALLWCTPGQNSVKVHNRLIERVQFCLI